MSEFDRYDILREARDNGGAINYSVKSKKLDPSSRSSFLAMLVEMKDDGYLNDPSNRKTVFHLSSLGKKVLDFGSFQLYEEEKKRDPALAIISSTFKEIANLNSKYAEIKDDSIKIQKSANIFTVVTIGLLFIQTIFVTLEYIYPPKQSLDTTLIEQVPQNKDSKNSLRELVDSSTTEPQRPAMKIDSTYLDSVKVKNK